MSKATNNYYKERILALIPEGKENAVNMKYFISMTGWARRDITDVIKALRKDYPICTTKEAPGGYWLGNYDDLIATKKMLEQDAQTIQKTITQVEDHLENLRYNRGKRYAD